MSSHLLAALSAASLLTAGVAGTAVETRAAAALPVAVAAAPAASASARCRLDTRVATKPGKAAACQKTNFAAPPQGNNGVGSEVSGVAGHGTQSQTILMVLGGALGVGGLAIALSHHNKSGG